MTSSALDRVLVRIGRPAADWPRRLPIRLARRALHAIAIRPLLHAEVHLDVGGLEDAAALCGPAVIVANHASHLDTPLLLDALPARRRERTGVAVTTDDSFSSSWQAAATAIAFNTFAQVRSGQVPSGRNRTQTPAELLAAGWSVVIYPEGGRSTDGYLGTFELDAAALAIEHRVPVLPVGIRGSFAAMPRGHGWPSRQAGPAGRTRTRISLRFGPAMTAAADESAEAFTERIRTVVAGLIAEDRGTWWQTQRVLKGQTADTAAPGAAATQLEQAEPPPGSWRRIWEQSQSPRAGGRRRRAKIWR
ncbi:1-acyl-sn-glycerol-3-phosphate acyltransferase [Microlunatus elymi]|uniref:1-acyl-sn-glycerol-3-phosphate acyltransferase n=1 Tax=Microlunatus elymi TaxID=2596828 RepID=A0A516Q0G5_9ACTN|nr:lysophospholipid acyltransferase family protein [Microlunatus elymi]QDP96935.1 1-acyl-sn-glycerol-3-phosphate acyltransferase [Microlunatus elymi]